MRAVRVVMVLKYEAMQQYSRGDTLSCDTFANFIVRVNGLLDLNITEYSSVLRFGLKSEKIN